MLIVALVYINKLKMCNILHHKQNDIKKVIRLQNKILGANPQDLRVNMNFF